MAIVPQLNSIISAVDRIHVRLAYAGGAFELRPFFETYPGFLLRGVGGTGLPRGVAAAMSRTGGCVRIVYDKTRTRGRQRFAIAHEIGHALLHAKHLEGCELRGTSFDDEAIAERQANLFAAELLMPVWALDRALPDSLRHGRAPKAAPPVLVRKLATHFDVSSTAMRIQLETYLSIRGTQAGRATYRPTAGFPGAELASAEMS